MQTKTTKIGNIQWTVTEETGLHVLDKRRLLAKVYTEDMAELDRWYEFFDCFCQSSDVTVPFHWPCGADGVEELKEARDAWLALPGRVYRAWKTDVETVNTPPGDVELLPPEMLSEEKKTTPASQPSEMSFEPA